MADLVRIAVTVNGEDEELLGALLAMHVASGWEEETLPTGETTAVVHTDNVVFASELEQELTSRLPEVRIRRETVEQKDWMSAWREYFTPVAAGSRFLVLAPWMEAERAASDRCVIVIEPKMAFGTGHHNTTALCLAALSDLADAGRIKPGMRFLDLGTGSGILGIACAKLGLTGLGLDIDILAVENALENRVANAVAEENFIVRRGGVEEAEDGYDLIVANILAQPLKDMAPDIARRLRPGGATAAGGVLVLSGLLGIQADAVAAAYADEGLPQPRRMDSGDWAALIWA